MSADEVPSLPGDPGAASFAQDLPPDDAPAKPGRRRSTTRRPRKDAAPKTPRATPGARKNTQIVQTVAGLHKLAGELMLPMVGKPNTGALLSATGDDAGKAWAALAVRYPMIERIFTTGTDGMLWVNLAMVYWPVLMIAMQEKAGPMVVDPDLASAMGGVYPNDFGPPASRDDAAA